MSQSEILLETITDSIIDPSHIEYFTLNDYKRKKVNSSEDDFLKNTTLQITPYNEWYIFTLIDNITKEVLVKTYDINMLYNFCLYKSKEVILVFSWGLDSTTVLYDLLDRWYNVVCMLVNYWQKHIKELTQAKEIAKRNNCDIIELDLSSVNIFQTSGLVNTDKELKDGLYDKENIEISMVPNRNSILANYALAVAMNRKSLWIALWIHSEDQTTGEIEYPDCSEAFVETLQLLAREIDFREYEVIVPFSGKHKGEVVKRWLELNVPYDITWSCYKWKGKHCWVCGTCIQRKNAFLYNNAVDPVEYEQ